MKYTVLMYAINMYQKTIQLNFRIWISSLALTPESLYCLMETVGEIFGLESKTWL